MNLMLFVAALSMTVIAMAFAVQPLIVSVQRHNSGYAKLSLLAVIVVFGMGLVLYGVVGRPELGSVQGMPSMASMRTTPQGQQGEKAQSVTALLGGLEARLADNSDDAKGWLLLAQSYDHLGRIADARHAYDKAAALGMTDAALESRLGDSGQASPTAGIRGRVSVADGITDRIDPDDVVYVVAKTDQNPMPLAVLRRSASELPFTFVLSDENSMVQGGGITGASTVVVSARLSKTGDALDTATKLGASSKAIDPKGLVDLALVIDVMPDG